MSLISAVDLLPHAEVPCPAVHELRVRVAGRPETALVLTYILQGDLAAIRLPPPAAATAADGLWHHTCFEFFIRRAGAAAYHEYNFASSGQWAAYAFRTYRERDKTVTLPPPRLRVSRRLDCLELEAILPPGALPGASASGRQPAAFQFGLSAVIEGSDGARSYWALRHPAAHPDFHHPDAFALTLDSPA